MLRASASTLSSCREPICARARASSSQRQANGTRVFALGFGRARRSICYYRERAPLAMQIIARII